MTVENAQQLFVTEMKAMVTHHNHLLRDKPLTHVLKKFRKMKSSKICKMYVSTMREHFADFTASTQDKILEHARSRKIDFLNDIAFDEIYDLLDEDKRPELIYRTIDLVAILKSLHLVKNPLFSEFADLPAKYANLGVPEDKVAGKVISDLFCDPNLFQKVASIMTAIPKDADKKKDFLEVTEAMGLINFKDMIKLQNKIDETKTQMVKQEDSSPEEETGASNVATIHVADETTSQKKPNIVDLMYNNRSKPENSSLQQVTNMFASLSQKQEAAKQDSVDAKTDFSDLLADVFLDTKERSAEMSDIMATVGQNPQLMQKLAKSANDTHSGNFSFASLLDAAQILDPTITARSMDDFQIPVHRPLTQRYSEDNM